MPGSDAGLCGDDGYSQVVRVRKIHEAIRPGVAIDIDQSTLLMVYNTVGSRGEKER